MYRDGPRGGRNSVVHKCLIVVTPRCVEPEVVGEFDVQHCRLHQRQWVHGHLQPRFAREGRIKLSARAPVGVCTGKAIYVAHLLCALIEPLPQEPVRARMILDQVADRQLQLLATLVLPHNSPGSKGNLHRMSTACMLRAHITWCTRTSRGVYGAHARRTSRCPPP